MENEIEGKWIVSDILTIRGNLTKVGASLIQPERLMRRKPYDFPDDRLGERGGWIRVRDEGDKITLTYKELRERSLDGMLEEAVVVSNFEKVCSILESIGLEAKSYQETRRETWLLNNCEVTIDTWPWIPPVVEIEGSTEPAVKSVATLLGFDWGSVLFGSIENVYAMYYEVSEDEVCRWKEIVFTPVPDWLKSKRKVNL